MKTPEQIKTATETIALLQDYTELAKIEKKLKSDVAKQKTDELIVAILDRANYNVGEVL